MNTSKKIISLTLCVFLLLSAVGCGKASSPEETVLKFRDAVNSLDTVAARECLNADLNRVLDIIPTSGTGNGEKLIKALLLALGISLLSDMDLSIPRLELEPTDCLIDGDSSYVWVDAGIDFGHRSVSKKLCIGLNFEDGKWLISSVKEAEDGYL